MFYLYFPGDSIINKNELDEFEDMFKKNGFMYHCQSWIHWTDQAKQFSFYDEIAALDKVLANIVETEFTIIGKSIGTMFASKIANKLGEKVKKIFLLGIPSGIFADNLDSYDSILENANSGKYIFQNTSDPFGDIQAVKIFANKGFNLIERDYEDHKYSVANEVEKIIL
jgi:pimeloyl-ACP methyl ester carboxylesterase